MSLPGVLARIDELTPQPPAAPAAAAASPVTSFADLLTQASPAPPSAPAPAGAGAGVYGPAIDAAAARNGLDPALVQAVIAQESGFDPNATSPAGAQGLMQLMPSTASSLGVTNPYDPTQSIDAGTRLLRSNLDRYGGNVALALAAYNAGSGAVDRYGGVPPYPETQRYVSQILSRYQTSVDQRSA